MKQFLAYIYYYLGDFVGKLQLILPDIIIIQRVLYKLYHFLMWKSYIYAKKEKIWTYHK